jgi:16S rRNA (cytosine967-C5)-methyltransferase
MTPAARIQAAIEILDAIAIAARDGGAPADAIFAEAMRARRYAGSKDRRAIRGLVYDAIRACRSTPVSGRAAMLMLADRDADLAAHFDGSHYGPAPISADEPRAEGGVATPAVIALFDPLIRKAEHDAMLVRAPVDLRRNMLKPDAPNLADIFPDGQAIAALPNAWRLPAESAAVQHPAHGEGAFEVQDAASQYGAGALDASAGMRVLDLCAGGGGKTLAIAAAAKNDIQILATDTHRARLQQLPPRAERAGATSIDIRLLNPNKELAMLDEWVGTTDRVFVDAPCSGSGTWRRSPELRWRSSKPRLDRHLADQARLLDIGALTLAKGGKMIYAVCSVMACEGREQVAKFLARHPQWTADEDFLPAGVGRKAGDGYLLTPKHDDCDGFFIARLCAP